MGLSLGFSEKQHGNLRQVTQVLSVEIPSLTNKPQSPNLKCGHSSKVAVVASQSSKGQEPACALSTHSNPCGQAWSALHIFPRGLLGTSQLAADRRSQGSQAPYEGRRALWGLEDLSKYPLHESLTLGGDIAVAIGWGEDRMGSGC